MIASTVVHIHLPARAVFLAGGGCQRHVNELAMDTANEHIGLSRHGRMYRVAGELLAE